MPTQNDCDIKIYGKSADDTDTSDLLEAAEYLNRQRRNGNISKAKTLGETLAALDPENEEGLTLEDLSPHPPAVTPAIQTQIRSLIVFLAQTALHKRLGIQLLSSCAVNAMYDKLVEIAPAFYDDICDGAAFTFYSLSVKEEDTRLDIGRHFAMLCGMEGKEEKDEYIAFGSDIYSNASQIIDDIIDAINFKRID